MLWRRVRNVQHIVSATAVALSVGLRRRAGHNLWFVISLLALGGWFFDSTLMSLKMHGSVLADLLTDNTHLWYGPPLLAVVVALARRYRQDLRAWLANTASFQSISSSLRPEAKQIALVLTRSETAAATMSYLVAYPTMMLMAHDLAVLVRHEKAEIQRELDELYSRGLVQRQCVGELTFYGLTQDKVKRSCLAEVIGWQRSWQEQAGQLVQAVGAGLLPGPDANGDRKRLH